MTQVEGVERARCPVPLEELERSAKPFNEAVVLPRACYTDPEFFEFEASAVWEHEWICVGCAGMVPNVGDFYTITVLNEPLIVVRNKERDVKVVSGVCRHRGMVICAPADRPEEEWTAPPPETSGNCSTFRCPYHWWTYDLDGLLVGAPAMDRTTDFDRSQIRLPELRTELWNGFVFVNLDAAAAPLAPRLGSLERFLENYRLEGMQTVEPYTVPDVPFNWKIMSRTSWRATTRRASTREFTTGRRARGSPTRRTPRTVPRSMGSWKRCTPTADSTRRPRRCSRRS